jgi:molybdopterin converting factor subunit 1
MTCRVHFFARARDLAGTGSIEIELPTGSRVLDLREQLALKFPALIGLLERSAIAVNDDYAEDGQVIPAQAEIALIPPVSGG